MKRFALIFMALTGISSVASAQSFDEGIIDRAVADTIAEFQRETTPLPAPAPEEKTCFCPECFSDLFSFHVIQSADMEPGLQPFDCVVFRKFEEGESPSRGQVVSLEHPVTGTAYIKRIIGLAGDKVQIRDGRTYINGRHVDRRDAGSYDRIYTRRGPTEKLPQCANSGVSLGEVCHAEKFVEILPGGVEHGIINIRDSRLDNTPIYTIPADHVFVMGDNRDNSTDSRVSQGAMGLGYIPLDNLVGKFHRKDAFLPKSHDPHPKLFRDIAAGRSFAKIMSTGQWEDCSYEGLQIVCHDDTFLNVQGISYVIFDAGRSFSVLFESDDPAFLQNALTILESKGYAPCTLDTGSGSVDLVRLHKEIGFEHLQSRVNEQKLNGFRNGYILSSYVETEFHNFFSHDTCVSLQAMMQNSERLIQLNYVESEAGIRTSLLFEMSLIDQVLFKNTSREIIDEDF